MKPKPIAELLGWASAHPVQTVVFTFLFTIIPIASAEWEERIPLGYRMAVFAAAVGGWLYSFWQHSRKVLAMLVLAALMTGQAAGETPALPGEAEPEFRPAAGYVAGGAVICLGGYCVYKLWKTCQRLFPKSTNSAPANVFFQATDDGDDEYGASWSQSSIGSCWEPDEDQFHAASEEARFIARLKIVVDENGALMSSLTAGKALPEQMQSWEEFQAEVALYGLAVDERGSGAKYYSLNRVPCGPDQVPIRFDEQTQTIVHAGFSGRMRTITIERSKDFQSWSRFMSVTTGYGTGLQVEDLTRSGQMFYRVVAE